MLSKVGSFLKQIGPPFVISADWRFEPASLQGSGWPAALDAAVFHADRGTCRPAANDIDYFVLNHSLTLDCTA
eukprot:2680922-Pyramimonas_sp.AAC.1